LKNIKEEEEEAITSPTIILPAPTPISPSYPSYNSSTTSSAPFTYKIRAPRAPYTPPAPITPTSIPTLSTLIRDTTLSSSLSIIGPTLSFISPSSP